MGNIYIFTTVIFLCNRFLIGHGLSQYIDLYTGLNYQSNRTQADVSECTNLPTEVVNTTSAANTQGFCARFFDDKDCTGNSIEMMPRSPTHNDLRHWGFDKKTVSIGPCREQCSVEVTGPVSTDAVEVAVFDRPLFRGAKAKISVKGCTPIPRKMNSRVMSVNTTGTGEGHCWQLYNNLDCKTNLTAGQDSIELRMGTPFHYDLRLWLLTDIKAISHCSFKCSKDKPQPEVEEITGDLILFDGVNYIGNALGIQKKDTESCTNLDQFMGWEGATNSVKFVKDENNCVTLFDDIDCTGEFQLKLNSSQPELMTKRFNGMARSVQFCD